jgi:hypothetical protein
MTLVAELLFIRMALHAGVLKADLILVAVRTDIDPVPVTDHLVAPIVQKLHML